MTRTYRKEFVERLADKQEEAANRQDLEYLNNSLRSSDIPVEDATGNVLSKDAEKHTRWREHFESILNRKEHAQVAEIPPVAEDLVTCIDPPTLKKVKVVIKAMKSGKAGEVDGVTAEILKAEEIETPCVRILTDI